jgi:colanic acid/amylovoran biosynthesis glycosyltransferase
LETERNSAGVPRVALYCATFLKPEMLHIHRQITALRRFVPHVITRKRENGERFPLAEVEIVPKPRTAWLRRIVVRQLLRAPVQIYRAEARDLARRIDRCGARVLHVFFGNIGVELLPLLEMRTVPSIVSFHGADVAVGVNQPRFRAAMVRMLGIVDRVLVRSESLGNELIALGCDRGKIRIHRTGIPLAEYEFARRDLPADGAFHCVQASRLIEKKGLRTTLRGFAIFARKFPHARLTIAGEGPLLEELQGLSQELEIEDRVRFAGFVSEPALRGLYREAHIFLHPSETGADGNQEGVPNAMLEAMATGLPPVATMHGGIPEAVDSGVNGILVEERDHRALGEALISLVEAPVKYPAMSRAAAEAVRERFDLERQTDAIEQIYAELAGVEC